MICAIFAFCVCARTRVCMREKDGMGEGSGYLIARFSSCLAVVDWA